MQRNVKNKIAFFTFGLFAGVTLGVVFGVAIKAVFSHLDALHISLSKIGTKEDQISQRLDSLEGKMSTQNKKSTAVITPKTTATKNSSESGDNRQKYHDTVVGNMLPVDNNDSILMPAAGDSNVVVMTNQLVSISSVPLTNLDSVKSKKSAVESDSMIASMNDLQQEKIPSNYRIEFWESPLNIKGYKMSKGKLILYGINSNSQLKLVRWAEAYYLLSGQVAYRVDYTDDFRPFERVADKMILKKFSL